MEKFTGSVEMLTGVLHQLGGHVASTLVGGCNP